MGVAFFVLGVLAWGAHNENIRISDVKIEGNSVVLDKDIKKEILKKENILNEFKRIYSVKVKTIGINSIRIIVKERIPFALWCGDSLYDDGRSILDKCYFMDEVGFIFIEAPSLSDSVYFEFYGTVDGGVIGRQFLTKEEFSRVILFKDLLNSVDIKVDKFLIAKNGDYTFYINNWSETAIFFNGLQDFNKIFYNLRSAIDTKTAESGGKDIFKGLKYIDLRFDNKVLFK